MKSFSLGLEKKSRVLVLKKDKALVFVLKKILLTSLNITQYLIKNNYSKNTQHEKVETFLFQ